MPASSRTVYGRDFRVTSLSAWILQRASGLLLGPLVALHVWVPAMAANRALNAALLVVILAHGYTGLKRVAVKRGNAGIMTAIAWAWCAAVIVFGAMLVLARP